MKLTDCGRPQVVILQRVLPHYRVPFFIQLAQRLDSEGISLKLIYGQEQPGTVPKTVQLDASWAIRVNNLYFRFMGLDLVWQPCLRILKSANLVIAEQANRLALNYFLLLLRGVLPGKFAFWGHGRNWNAKSTNLSEKLKRFLANKADWWFAYTESSAAVVNASGMPREKISTVFNTVDIQELTDAMACTTPEQLNSLRKAIGISTTHVGVFCGGMNAEKHVDFLLDACVEIRALVPDFEMVFIGGGPEQSKIEQAARDHQWIHYVGPKYGADRVPYLMLGKALLMPGLIGLAIIDSFVMQTPLFTTDIQGHGPEIDYLENGVNAVMTPHAKEAYVKAVASYLSSAESQSTLRNGCAQATRKYTLDNMVSRFVEGIKRCLDIEGSSHFHGSRPPVPVEPPQSRADMRTTGVFFHPLRVVVVTNIPAPYRVPVYCSLARQPDIDLHVIFCNGHEWDPAQMHFAHSFLNESFVHHKRRNHDLWSLLDSLMPEVVITTGFNPVHLIAYAWSRTHGARHVAMTDGTLESETTVSGADQWIRRHIYAHSAAFIGAGEGSMRLYQSYGIGPDRIFKSPLCADNSRFLGSTPQPKTFDFLFASRFEAVKNPFFALDVAQGTAVRLGRRVSIAFLGSGSLQAQLAAYAKKMEAEVETTFAGMELQADLPRWYAAARVFLFPTQRDPWGTVANEACAAGIPVLISSLAGAAGDLVRDGENGFVLPLDEQRWIDAAVTVLTDERLSAAMGSRGRDLVREYSYENAAMGIAQAARAADRVWQPWSQYKSRARPKVMIIQRRMTQYRVPLFDAMRERLDAAGVELLVAYGDPLPAERLKADSGHLPWGIHVPCRYWLGGRLCWQNAMHMASNASLVIVTQENRLLFNYVRPILRKDRKWAFWGHGRNFQATSRFGLRERFKRWLTSHVDWWFAYTSISRQTVIEAGFPPQRITTLNNSIDTGSLARDLSEITAADIERARRKFGIDAGPIGLSLASLHADKRLDFLFASAKLIRERVPDFQLVLVGDGPQRDVVSAAVRESGGWIHWLGARTGREKALALAMSNVMLNPGMVGLAVLDSFVAGVPMVTTFYPHHSPEIAYLQSGENGLITENDFHSFARGVARLLSAPGDLRVMRERCLESAKDYSIERMADNFCNGILDCLTALARPVELADRVTQIYRNNDMRVP